MHWYVVQVYSGSEKQAKRLLQERIKSSDIAHMFGDILVPVESVVEMRNGQKRQSERKFFPGYMFIQMEMEQIAWYLVCQTPRILGFVGGAFDKLNPLPDAEVAQVLNKINDVVGKVNPKTVFEPGEIVRVIEGPFADFNGVVEEANYDKNKLQVAVTIFGRSTPVELDFNQVEKI